MLKDVTDKAGAQTKAARQQRLKILGQDEIDVLFRRPCFTQDEREQYFALSASEQAVLNELKTTKSKIAFILQLGYFKARRMFFVFTANDVAADLNHVVERYFPGTAEPECTVSKRTRLKHQDLILELCGYRTCDAAAREELEEKAKQATAVCSKPVYVFRQVLHFLVEQRIVSPAYSSLQNLVGKALTHEQNRMGEILRERNNSPPRVKKSALSNSRWSQSFAPLCYRHSDIIPWINASQTACFDNTYQAQRKHSCDIVSLLFRY